MREFRKPEENNMISTFDGLKLTNLHQGTMDEGFPSVSSPTR